MSLRRFEREDSNHFEVIPFKTEIILTDRFTVYTVHLMKDNGKTICNQFADGECMRKDHYNDPIYKFKKCKKCFQYNGGNVENV